ncbi:RNA polymerase sigma factor [Skermanella aerolata]|uniref:RNA polymerase sigma factor n=1 Tax=Skermanella aerolata TaxID=393310 RepID=UPI00146FCC52
MKIVNNPSNLVKARQAVSALPDEERAVLILVCAEGLSYRDAAEKLSISQAELQGRLLRARLALMKNMSAPISLFEKRKPDFLSVAEVACLPARKF